MRTPLFVSLATGATLLVGGGVAVAMAGEPVSGSSRAVIAQPSATSESPSLSPGGRPPAGPSSRPAITREQAQNIALRLVGGGRLESTELEWEDGRLIWDVDVVRQGVKWDIEIDSRTGQVVESKADRDRGDHRDDDRSGPGGDDGDHDGGHDDGDNSGPGGDDDGDNSGSGGG